MTVKEYNHNFLPKIKRAESFIRLFDNSIEHMNESKVDKTEVYKQFNIRGYSDETVQTILTALDYYRVHEGVNKINNDRCNCYEIRNGKSICLGTKECEPCSCNGYETKCSHYPKKRGNINE